MTPPKDQAPRLVARLREADVGYSPGTMFSEAADRIEQLEAENAELRGKVVDGKEAAWDEAVDQARIAVADYHFNIIDAVCAVYNSNPYRTEQANIRSPVQSEMSKMVDPR